MVSRGMSTPPGGPSPGQMGGGYHGDTWSVPIPPRAHLRPHVLPSDYHSDLDGDVSGRVICMSDTS